MSCSGYDITAFDMAAGIEPTPACAGEPHLSACTAQAGAGRSTLCLPRDPLASKDEVRSSYGWAIPFITMD